MQDAVVKGRIARGESQGGSKLTANDVVAIRNAYAAGGQTQEAIARKYDVTKSLIGCIVRGEHWRHVGGKSNNGIAANNRARGERNGNVKLTVDDIRAIRERYAAGEGSQETLAKEYGTVQSHVGRIVNRQNWRHI